MHASDIFITKIFPIFII